MTARDTTMTVECRTCPVRELHCGDCMVPVLIELAAPSARAEHGLDPQERAAVTLLVQAGLVDVESAARARAVTDRPGSTAPVRTDGGWAVG